MSGLGVQAGLRARCPAIARFWLMRQTAPMAPYGFMTMSYPVEHMTICGTGRALTMTCVRTSVRLIVTLLKLSSLSDARLSPGRTRKKVSKPKMMSSGASLLVDGGAGTTAMPRGVSHSQMLNRGAAYARLLVLRVAESLFIAQIISHYWVACRIDVRSRCALYMHEAGRRS